MTAPSPTPSVSPPDASVRLIVLNYNGGEDVLDCLRSLFDLRWPEDRLDIVVVDNASVDGSDVEIERRFPAARLVRSSRNVGFAANNLGFTDLRGVDFVGLVNNDAFLEPDALRHLVAALDSDPGLGAACPKILLANRFHRAEVTGQPRTRLLAPTGSVPGEGFQVPDDVLDPRPVLLTSPAVLWIPVDADITAVTGEPTVSVHLDGNQPHDLVNNVGNELDERWFGVDRGLHQPDTGQFDRTTEVFAWCGAAVLFRSAYLEQVGGFDERLFLYYEDLDLAWRGRELGWRYRYVPAAVVRHRHGASTGIGSLPFRYFVERNRLVVLAKHAPAAIVLGAAARHLLATLSYLRRDLLVQRRRSPVARVRIMAFGGFLRLLPAVLRERWKRRR